jgi:hypothetical protein
MSSLTIKRSLAAAAVIAGLFGIAGTANAQGGGAAVGTSVSDLLGATGPKSCISDGTSNTVLFALRG